MLGLTVVTSLGAGLIFNGFSYFAHLAQMQRLAGLVYPGSTLTMHWQSPPGSSGTRWDTKLYQTPDRLASVRAYLEKQLPGFLETHSSLYTGVGYLNSISEQSPADWLNFGAPAPVTPRGVSVEIYAATPITAGTLIKIKTTWFEP